MSEFTFRRIGPSHYQVFAEGEYIGEARKHRTVFRVGERNYLGHFLPRYRWRVTLPFGSERTDVILRLRREAASWLRWVWALETRRAA